MCGIAVIISGIKIDLACLISDFNCPSSQCISDPVLFSEKDIKAALQRRGPNSLGSHIINLCSNISPDEHKDLFVQSFVQTERVVENGCKSDLHGELRFIGATLQLRGLDPVFQPLTDAFGNVLVYNGEIYGGIHIGSDNNDTEILMQSLRQCCSCISSICSQKNRKSVPELLSRIRGPWALIYWQDSSKTLWFGRDAFGRRSLLVHWPTQHDPRLLLSSVSPPSSTQQHYVYNALGFYLLQLSRQKTGLFVLLRKFEGCNCNISDHISKFCQLRSGEKYINNGKEKIGLNFWEELSCGVYSISMAPNKTDGHLIGQVKKHEWTDPELNDLITWERALIKPKSEDLSVNFSKVQIKQENANSGLKSELSEKVLLALRESVKRRTALNRIYQDFLGNHGQERDNAPIAVLFSGGLDSMIIAALLHQCIDSEYYIDLLNVSFDGELAPDRISGKAGLKELQKIVPSRRWNLVEIDADLLRLTSETKHVMSLINPAETYMDLNIGIALWLASGGDGWLYEMEMLDRAKCQRVKYKSMARILLVGSGADEQCAGYGRHKTKFRNTSWLGLHEEMKLDMQRIWKRNLGRDDRCMADNGKEARFPFLDEDVIRTLLSIPLWDIADLNQPSGVGDKKILREVARLLGLNEAARLPKRAIQFGSRIARESNRKNFGSNRAANQASAGSVVIYKSSDNNTVA